MKIVWCIAASLYMSICLGAARESHDDMPGFDVIPEFIICENTTIFPGGYLSMQIPTSDIEPLTGKTFGTLVQESLKKGLLLPLASILWLDSFNGELSRENVDIRALLREPSVRGLSGPEEVVQKYVQRKKEIITNDCYNVEMWRPSKLDVYRGWFLVGPEYKDLTLTDVIGSYYFCQDDASVLLENPSTASLFFKALVAKDMYSWKIFALFQASITQDILSRSTSELTLRRKVLKESVFILNGFLKISPKDQDALERLEKLQAMLGPEFEESR